MAPADLRQLLSLLEKQGELVRIGAEADPLLEIAAITDRVCKSPGGGPALLFTAPRGSDFPLATNLFGSPARVSLALGVEQQERLTQRMLSLLEEIGDPRLERLDRQISALPRFARFTPPPAPGSDPQLIPMASPNLGMFPFLQSWPGDGSADRFPRYITLGQVFTRHPESGEQNCGMYGAQLRGPRELALRWKPGSGAARHLDLYRRRGTPMPVAVTLGGPPSLTFSSLFPLPGELDEVAFAGFLAGAPLSRVSCSSVPLLIPAGCELLIEGYVNPGETVREGPFGNHSGCYSPATQASLMRVTAISHRRDAIIPATVVGPPPMEDCWMAQAWERLLLAFLRRLFPAIVELHFPLEWVFHQSAFISLETPTPAMVRETAAQLWETPWFSSSRLLLFVDSAIPSGSAGAAWAAINNCDLSADLFRDHTGKRAALDATASRLPQQRIQPDREISRRISQRWKEFGLE